MQASVQKNDREVEIEGLPLYCPGKDVPSAEAHPRVYLPISAQHPQVTCPYCGACYRVKSKKP